jgi:hypothetical protein
VFIFSFSHARLLLVFVFVVLTFSTSVLLAFFVCVLCVFYYGWPRLGPAGQRPPGGVRAGASELALPLPKRFSTFLLRFLYVFYRIKSLSILAGKYDSPWRTRFFPFVPPFSVRCFLCFPPVFIFRFSTFSVAFYHIKQNTNAWTFYSKYQIICSGKTKVGLCFVQQ